MSSVQIGMHLPEVPDCLDELNRWQRALGSNLSLVSIYQAWDSPYRAFWSERLQDIHARGLTTLITWEPWALPGTQAPCSEQPAFSLRRLLAGDYNSYIRRWAAACRAFDEPLLLRPMHEMNGNWYPWCGTVNGNTAEEFVGTWKHLRRFFEEAGAKNVQWVWSPHASSHPPTTANALSQYYPGDAWVDWIGLSGHNWGPCSPDDEWQRFEEVFADAYRAVTALADLPLMIAEIASAEKGGNKAQWVAEAFRTIAENFPRVELLVWFNVEKERDWRVDSSPEAANAFLRAVGENCGEALPHRNSQAASFPRTQ
jgi:beta-mannanase